MALERSLAVEQCRLDALVQIDVGVEERVQQLPRARSFADLERRDVVPAGQLDPVLPLQHVDQRLVPVLLRGHERGSQLRARDFRARRLVEIDGLAHILERFVEVTSIAFDLSESAERIPLAQSLPGLSVNRQRLPKGCRRFVVTAQVLQVAAGSIKGPSLEDDVAELPRNRKRVAIVVQRVRVVADRGVGLRDDLQRPRFLLSVAGLTGNVPRLNDELPGFRNISEGNLKVSQVREHDILRPKVFRRSRIRERLLIYRKGLVVLSESGVDNAQVVQDIRLQWTVVGGASNRQRSLEQRDGFFKAAESPVHESGVIEAVRFGCPIPDLATDLGRLLCGPRRPVEIAAEGVNTGGDP